MGVVGAQLQSAFLIRDFVFRLWVEVDRLPLGGRGRGFEPHSQIGESRLEVAQLVRARNPISVPYPEHFVRQLCKSVSGRMC
jgi:hypothetical protein